MWHQDTIHEDEGPRIPSVLLICFGLQQMSLAGEVDGRLAFHDPSLWHFDPQITRLASIRWVDRPLSHVTVRRVARRGSRDSLQRFNGDD